MAAKRFMMNQSNYRSGYGEFFTELLYGLGANAQASGSKIVNTDSSFLHILLVDTRGDVVVPTSPPIKIEIVVLDGDFPSDDRNTWNSEEFDKNILKERTGKRPLLAGDCLTVTLRDGIAALGEIEFTDNSSWIRSRKFRLVQEWFRGASTVLGFVKQ
ncbi:hypothetical protein GH714_033229 [Hevea brasiliensis]|uniref:Calmodulin binding protein-like N-terminal domain-containing protein n=1 Tax=Hevea brasiliensis TaxID=3981 RepID=A0A6A6L5L3_HEVBR|nr:hypothetical protein GH714_033229 [Hevea brasiliensis]